MFHSQTSPGCRSSCWKCYILSLCFHLYLNVQQNIWVETSFLGWNVCSAVLCLYWNLINCHAYFGVRKLLLAGFKLCVKVINFLLLWLLGSMEERVFYCKTRRGVPAWFLAKSLVQSYRTRELDMCLLGWLPWHLLLEDWNWSLIFCTTKRAV